jgi:hypothetical protein
MTLPSIDEVSGSVDETGAEVGSAVGADGSSVALPEQATATNSDADITSHRAPLCGFANLLILDAPLVVLTTRNQRLPAMVAR